MFSGRCGATDEFQMTARGRHDQDCRNRRIFKDRIEVVAYGDGRKLFGKSLSSAGRPAVGGHAFDAVREI
ncbi:hypothetical protein FHX08_003699 [Rhizobium sp. BK529]|nr:hypothetical protein [Rhizobium sp. BK529]